MTDRILAALRDGPIHKNRILSMRCFGGWSVDDVLWLLRAHHGELWRVERGVVFPLSEIWR